MSTINANTQVFYKHALDLGEANHDYNTQPFKVALLNDVPLADRADITFTSVSANEVTGGGYISGGKDTTVSWIMNNDKAVLDLTDVVWSVDIAGPTDIKALVVYNTVSDKCIAFADIRAPGNQDLSLQAGDIGIQFNVLGLYSLSMI